MADEESIELPPHATGEEPLEIALDLVRMPLLRESEASSEPEYVRIDGNALVLPKGRRENNRRRLAADPREAREFLHRTGDSTTVLSEEDPTELLNVLCLHAERPAGVNECFELSPRKFHVILRGPAGTEEHGRHHIHACIGTLRAQDRRNEQVERRTPAEERMRRMVEPPEFPKDERWGETACHFPSMNHGESQRKKCVK